MAFATKVCLQSLVLQTMMVEDGRHPHPELIVECQHHCRSPWIIAVYFHNPCPFVLLIPHVPLLLGHYAVVSCRVAEIC